jgi:hypothetical protein
MKPLTETQHAILRGAAEHPHGLAAPPPNLPPAPCIAVAKALIGTGLLAHAQSKELHNPSPAWKLDGAALVLRITELGRRVIGTGPTVASERGLSCTPR